jgi:hypothetical protein
MIEAGGVFDGQCLLAAGDEEAVPMVIPIRSVSLASEIAT